MIKKQLPKKLYKWFLSLQKKKKKREKESFRICKAKADEHT